MEDGTPEGQNEQPDLSFVTTSELIVELRNRCHAFLVVTQCDHKTDPQLLGTQVWYKGSATYGLGLAEYARMFLGGELFAGREAAEDDT